MLVMTFAATQASANPKYAGIVIDARTGKTLYENSADAPRYPASLTKMMTLYLTFEALDAGRITKDSRIPVSANAAGEVPSKLGLRSGSTLTVDQAMKALVTKSANDAATALGEFLGGSEGRFAQLMTNKARQLGMSRTTFKNAHGLPNSEQKTTARDMARLGIALREHFPHHYHYFSTRSFTFGKATYGNHNRLLGSVRGVDGIKTGFINASGFNLVSSVKDDGRLIVGVVMGGRTGASRNAQMQKLIAEYLPKATRGGAGTGNLIARSGASPMLAASAWSLPEKGPLPVFRDPIDMRVATAYAPAARTNALAAFPVPDGRPIVGRQALAAVLREQQPDAPVPPAAIGQVEMGSSDVDTVTTASTSAVAAAAQPAPSGWVVQVAAMPDQNEAMAFLSAAQTKAGGAIADARPYTVAYSDGGQQLYRARFAGFDGKDDAWAACDSLKRSGYGCWATQQ
ncbi:serine hydrolase [Pararhizobium haloflavum]|uniref:serine hydrolase n=1 Tax=Pararhizobium haloflavum TaxID=2037914 RepID=UPI000C1759C6